MKPYINPQSLVFNAKRTPGFQEYLWESNWEQWDLLQHAQNIVDDYTCNWDEETVISASTVTYMVGDFIDSLLREQKLEYRTNFHPNLRVEKYGKIKF